MENLQLLLIIPVFIGLFTIVGAYYLIKDSIIDSKKTHLVLTEEQYAMVVLKQRNIAKMEAQMRNSQHA